MEEHLEIKQKIKLLPLKLKARAKALYELFDILREVVNKSAGLKARVINNPFTVYREKGYDGWGDEFWGIGELIKIHVDDEGELKLTYYPKETGKVGTEIELFEIILAFEEQEKRFLEWLSQILGALPGDIDLTAEFIKTIDTKLQEKAEKIYCYRYESGAYPKTYIKFRQLERTEKATPAFSMDMYDYNTNKSLTRIYFNSTTEIVEAIKYLIEGFQYLGRKTTDELPF